MMAKKVSKKLDPKAYTQAEFEKRYHEALASGEIEERNETLPELREEKK
jgi:hypothetical protein